MKFPTYEQMAKNVAEKALDEFLYAGKSIREWMKIITEQEPCRVKNELKVELNELEPCTDSVSRQAVLDGIDTYISKAQSTGTQDDFYSFAELVVKVLPSVRPQEQTGQWIKYPHNSGIVVCNQCKGIRRDCRVGYTNYCNRCGCRMVEQKESEDK